VSQNYKFAYHI